MSIFSQMWERVVSGKRDENRKKNPRSRQARLEALEDRQLLTVAPGPMPETALVSEIITVTNDDALVTAEALDDSSSIDDVYFIADDSNDADDGDYSPVGAENGVENTVTVNYLDYEVESGKFVQKSIEATVVDGPKDGGWTSGWYVVRGNIKMENADVWCNGDVHLILEDGCNLTIQAKDGKAGFACADNTACSLTVYGQSGGTGELHVTGGDKGAGIGGVEGCGGRGITINGGVIYARGGGSAAGIGGGYEGSGYNITINGGTVDAIGGTDGDAQNGDGGAGIGGGNKGSGSNITIRGGTVHAYGGANSAGIGGGEKKNGEGITITGGTVDAHGGYRGAGIGGAGSGNIVVSAGYGKNITISGGTVRAFGGDAGGAGIGGGNGRWGAKRGDGENITINGGTVEAVGGADGCGIGDGNGKQGTNIRISTDSLIKTGEDSGSARAIINKGGDLSKTLCQSNGKKYVSIVSKAPQQETVYYIDQNGEQQQTTATVVGEWMNYEWKSGWYVVKDDVTMNDSEVWCNGDVKLILADGCNLTITGAKTYAGIAVVQSDARFTVYGQSGNSGVLKVTGGEYGAGIGGNEERTNQAITINGGKIYAQGGGGAAGLGGGYKAVGQNITINGGYVEAKGGEHNVPGNPNDGAAGIGGGYEKNGEHITITGGTVVATGAIRGAGIGGGEKASGSNITISGGTVTAQGGNYGAGIGGGGSTNAFTTKTGGSGSNITISGGTVTAKGGESGAGIGGGGARFGIAAGDAVDVLITGGKVEARGGEDAAGIGGGGSVAGDADNITITGGTVDAYGGSCGAGIGGGRFGDANGITISGGIVNAFANKDDKESAAAIGGGLGHDNGQGGYGRNITISGGTVSAHAYGTNALGGNGKDGLQNPRSWEVKINVALNAQGTKEDGKKETIPNNGNDLRKVLLDYTDVDITGTPLTSVTIAGTANVGATLTATVAPNDATASFAWYRSGEDASIGSGSTYKVTTKDVGHTLTVKATGVGVYSGEVSATTQSVPKIALAKPENFKITSTTDCSIAVSWNAVENASGYQVEYRVKDSKNEWTIFNTKDTTFKIDGLKDNTIYRVRVKACGTGVYSDSAYQESDATTKTALTGVSIGGVAKIGETLTATVAPNGATATYAWYRSGVSASIGSGATYTVTTADAGAVLTVKATATGDYFGEVSSSISVITTKLATPENFKSTSFTDKSIAVSWKSVPNASGYSLEYKGSKEDAWKIVDVRDVTFTIDGLDLANQTYLLRVKAVGAENYLDSDYAQIAVTSYLDENGQKKFTEACVVTSNMKSDWNGGWYVAVGSVTMNDARVRCVGDVRLILADGCNLTITGSTGHAGIEVSPANWHSQSLRIYGQSAGTNAGVLNAYGGWTAAAIGGSFQQCGANITINGGVVNAIGKNSGSGIGGGMKSFGCNITINGGVVYAEGATGYAAIGGLYSGHGITINGGSVRAVGGYGAPGIGGVVVGHDITINGGSVNASGGEGAAGIGGGWNGNGFNITINGGSVQALGGVVTSGIGGGRNGFAGNITISTSLSARGGNDAGSATPFAITGGDMASELWNKRYVEIKPNGRATTPENFLATETTDSSIAVSWDAVENASGYRVEYRVKSSRSEWTVFDLTDTTLNIDGLKPNTEYRIRIKALGENGYSDSAYVKFNVTTEKAALTSVSINGTAEVGATLTATVDPNGATASYAWYRSGVSEPVGTGATYTVTTEDVGAFLTVKATGADDYTGVVFASTEVLAPVQQLAKPKKFNATSTTDDSITISWKAVANADGYQIEYRVKGSNKKWTVLETEDTTITVDGLKSDKTYRIRVKALGSGAYLDSDYAKLDATTDAAFVDDQDEAIPTGTVATNAWNLSRFVGVFASVAVVEVAPVKAPTTAGAGKIAGASDARSDVFATFGEDEFDALDLDVAFDALV